jgi:predicted RNA-binding Zn-ribbon protein involved in translation (DUF1610 family)
MNESERATTTVPCPGCGTPQKITAWRRLNRYFTSLDCSNCGVTYGRIQGPNYSGTWHNLGDLSSDEGPKVILAHREDEHG